MAVYKGREVHILGRTNGEDVSPMYDVLDQWGERSSVKLSELYLTGKEIEEQKKYNPHPIEGANKIEDKDLQSLRDSQDKKKIEDKQGDTKTEPVAVKKVMVDPTEINANPTAKVVKK